MPDAHYRAEPLTRQDEREYTQLPNNVEAEQALLAAILVNNNAFHQVSDFLRPEHFAYGVHGRVYDVIDKQIAAGHQVTPVTLYKYFENDEGFKEQDGGAKTYFARLARSVVTIINTADYGRQILDLWKRRRLVLLAYDIEDSARMLDLDTTANDIGQVADGALYEILAEHQRGDGLVPSGDSVAAALQEMDRAAKSGGKLLGLPTGIPGLDEHLAGLKAGELYIIAGRPSMGKSLVANNVATAAAAHLAEIGGGWVAHFSLEMRHTDESMRRLSRWAQLDIERIQRGNVTPQEVATLVELAEREAALPLAIDDTPGLTLAEIRSRCRRLLRQRGKLGLVVVDHLGLITPPKELMGLGEVTQISHTSKGLKHLAKELGVPVVALSQLSREVEKRENKRPMLSDLRASGSIEQDADAVVFCFRDFYYLERETPVKGPRESDLAFQEREAHHNGRLEDTRHLGELIIAKNRMGRAGVSCRCFYDGATSTFGAKPARADGQMRLDRWVPE